MRATAPAQDSGRPGRRYVIRNGSHVMSMDPAGGRRRGSPRAGRGQEDRRRAAEHQALGADEIDAGGRIVMPGFVDMHHHLFETAFRSHLTNGVLLRRHGARRDQLLRVHPVEVRPGILAEGRLHQRAVRRARPDSTPASPRCTTSRRSTIRRSIPTPRSRASSIPTAAPPSATSRARARSPATSTRPTRAASKAVVLVDDQLVSMVMGGEIYLPGFETAWKIGRALRPPGGGAHVSPFVMRPTFEASPPAATAASGPTTCSST